MKISNVALFEKIDFFDSIVVTLLYRRILCEVKIHQFIKVSWPGITFLIKQDHFIMSIGGLLVYKSGTISLFSCTMNKFCFIQGPSANGWTI